MTRLKLVFSDLLLFLAFADVWVIAISWCTSRRMPREPPGCLYACTVVGGDGLRHYLAHHLLRLRNIQRTPNATCSVARSGRSQSSRQILCRRAGLGEVW